MKSYRRICGFRSVICMLSVCMSIFLTVGCEKKEQQSDGNSKVSSSKDVENDAYDNYLKDILKEVRTSGGVVCEIKNNLTVKGQTATIQVPKDGTYVLGFTYNSAEHKKTDIDLTVKVNEDYVAENIKLEKIYQDEGEVRRDGQGNEFAAEQVDFQQCVLIYPTKEQTLNLYEIDLTKGEHQISVMSNNDTLYLSEIVLKAKEKIGAYEEPKDTSAYYSGDAIVREGENSLWKNSQWLVALSDNGSWQVHPADSSVNRINYIGGGNWKQTGETITWEVDVPDDGYYRLGFSYRQSMVVNYSSYRRLLIDGEIPFAEAGEIEFPYTNSWSKKSLENFDGTPYLIYLAKGKHMISLQVTLGQYQEICQRMEKVVAELGDLNLKMTMITGETVDISRDYNLFKSIPNLQERLEKCVSEMNSLEKEIINLCGGESNSYSLVLRNMVHVSEEMLDNKYSAARYKSDFYSHYTSLSVCFSDMQEQPLDIDEILIGAPEDNRTFQKESGIVNLVKKIGFSTKRFVNSFFKDYNSVSGSLDESENNEKLTLWVNWGQDQARVLNSLIQTDFTTEYGIDVEVQVVNASIVQAILSGNGPDVVLQQSRTEPVNLAMRGALYDLTQFEDCEEVLKQFADSAATPYYYQDGLYALPDTQSFYVLFYRKDVLDEFGIEVPTTWEEFDAAAKTLQHNNLSAWLPYTQINASTTVNMGVGDLTLFPTLLLQNGVELYAEDGKSTNLTSAESMNVFRNWTEYYTDMKFPTEMNFYNRFRAGTCPLGIISYSTAVLLGTEAPELEGLWAMANVPGTVREDGSIDSSIAGGGTGCSILNISENKDAAWKFLKWWTSAETQLSYSTNLESILGPLGRVMVANTEALESLAWTEEELSAIMAARENLRELPEVPGGYQVSRSIDMAFYNVVNTNVNAKDSLLEWGQIADDEIKRKWEQYEAE